MSKIFTITINPFRAPFMREKMIRVQAICKYRDGSTYKYSEYAYGKPHCGRIYRWTEGDNTVAERERYIPRFQARVEKAYEKAVTRFNNTYAGINYADEVVSTYMPYPNLTDATKNVMSERWVNYNKDKQFLENIRSRLLIKWTYCMTLAQQGNYKAIGNALYHVHVYYLELSSLCRPQHHEVVYKGDNDPLLANRS